MFNSNDVVCAIELGTSKISVLTGTVSPEGRVDITGSGCVPSEGIVKGEITDMAKAEAALYRAIEAANAAGQLIDCKLATILVTGCDIGSLTGVGTVNIQGTVTRQNIISAEDNAAAISLAHDRDIINRSTSYYMLDNREVPQPEGMHGNSLSAHVHLVHGNSARIQNFTNLAGKCGFEHIDIIFSPLAASFGIISEQERQNGTLLIDFGMGCTDYVVEFSDGISGSGVLQVGFDHVANDLSIALDTGIDGCRRILESGELANARSENRQTITVSGGLRGPREIPVTSFESVIDMRLRETFEIIREQLVSAKVQLPPGVNVIATGGGSLYYRTREIIGEVFGTHCQVRRPADLLGASTGLNNPRYSAVWGALKFAAESLRQSGQSADNPLDMLVNGLNRLFDNSRIGLKNFGKSIKF